MATVALNYEVRKAALKLLNIYNSAVAAFPGGQAEVANATQAALTNKAGLKSLIAGRGVLPSDKDRMDRAAEQVIDLLDACGITDANIAADNTLDAFRTRVVALCASGVNKLFQDNNLLWI